MRYSYPGIAGTRETDSGYSGHHVIREYISEHPGIRFKNSCLSLPDILMILVSPA